MSLLLAVLSLSLPQYAAETGPRVQAVVDWQRNKIFLDASWKLSGVQLTTSNTELRGRLRAAMLTRLSVIVAGLWNKASAPEPGAEVTLPELADFWAMQKLSTFQVAENHASASMEIMLRGKESLMAHLPLPYASELGRAAEAENSAAYDKRPGMGEYDSSAGEALLYTGLVIDARHLSYHPSLNTGIFTGSGRQIYGVEFLGRTTAIKRGVTGHFAQESSADLRQRAGKRPLKVSALEVAGHGENSLVISDEDAAKLTAHTGSVQNLRRARVVILVSPDKLREKF